MPDIALIDECRDWWTARFADAPPVAEVLRHVYRNRWLRIHSLPQSRRYAETEADYEELLMRHNTVATEVLGEGADCYVIEGSWIAPTSNDGRWVVHCDEFGWQYSLDVSMRTWGRNCYNALLREIADMKGAYVVFVSQTTNLVYAPYNGGADLIVNDERERDKYKRRYTAWLSTRPDGL